MLAPLLMLKVLMLLISFPLQPFLLMLAPLLMVKALMLLMSLSTVIPANVGAPF